MEPDKQEKKLDELLSSAIDGKASEPDFKAWKQKYNSQIQQIEEQTNKNQIPLSVKSNAWRTIMKSKMTRLAVAAMIVIAVLVGVKMLGGFSERPGGQIVKEQDIPQKTITVETRKETNSDPSEKIESVLVAQNLEAKLRDIDLMLAAGNIDGLAVKLSKGNIETKLAVANYLATVESEQALEVLEKLNAGYRDDDPYNPFALAVEKSKNRIKSATDESTTEPQFPKESSSGQTKLLLTDERAGAEKQGDDDTAVDSLEDSEEIVDASLEVNTGPTLTQGVSGSAYYFDGAGDYIDIGNDSSLQTELFTITAWIETSDIGRSWQTIVSYEQGSHAVSVVSGRVNYGWQWIFVGGVRGTSEVRTGEWVFVTVTRDSDNKVSIYVNGEFEKSSVVSTESSFLHSAKIGGDTIDGEWFNGLIDEVAIYNKALSMEEIQRLYQSPETMTGGEAGLVGYWNFDNDDEDIVKDSSSLHNDGKLSHAIGVSKPELKTAESKPELAEGILGNAYYFDGAGDYIDIGNDPSLQTELFTITAWIETSDIGRSWQTIVSYEQGSHAVSVVSGRVNYGWQWIFVGGVRGTSEVRTGEWVYICVTRDSDN
ncbi:MAG: LamG domain-containing protein, partial [Planctomycetota bacterium]